MGRTYSSTQIASSPEWKLILACARTRLSDSQRLQIQELLKGPVEWAPLIELAVRQRVEALLGEHLTGEFAGLVPLEALVTLKEIARALGQWNLRLAGQMFRVLDIFEKGGLVVAPYKGPTLGALAYGNFALRRSEDLDFVLPQQDVECAFNLLLEAGFRSDVDPSIPRHSRFLKRGDLGQYLFQTEAGAMSVELHTEKTMRYFPAPLDWDRLQARTETATISGHLVRTFSAEDLLVLLSVHGAKHFWSRLSWICDIAELTRIPRGVDWALSEELARNMGCRRLWLLGLSLAREVLDASLPEAIIRAIAEDHGVALLRKRIQLLPDSGGNTGGVNQRLRFRMLAHESKADGLRQCIRVSTRITEDDWLAVTLPEWAEPLYVVLRPWRLLCKYGLNLRRAPAPDLAPYVSTAQGVRDPAPRKTRELLRRHG